LMEKTPYIGIWKDDGAQTSTLSQHLSGVTGGSAVQFAVAWNNAHHTQPESGKSMTFEIEYAGQVYAQVVTPKVLSGPSDTPPAFVMGLNGATTDVAEVQSWIDPNGNYGGWSTPDDLSGFETVTVRLPIDIPEEGDFILRWKPDTQGGGHIDDLMIAN